MSVMVLGATPTQLKSQKPRSVAIRHRTKTHGIALLPIHHKPLTGDSIYPCPNCQVIHTNSFGRPVKTVHLYLDDNGGCLVSAGVLADIKKAGHLGTTVDIVADVVNPPGITLGRNRLEVDQANSKISIWKKEPVIV
jgi:hypothetical protein